MDVINRYMLYAGLIEQMNPNEQAQTCLRVTKVTRNRIAKLGTKDQTFEQILKDMLDRQPSGESIGK